MSYQVYTCFTQVGNEIAWSQYLLMGGDLGNENDMSAFS